MDAQVMTVYKKYHLREINYNPPPKQSLLFFLNSLFFLIVIVQLSSLMWTFLRNPHHQTHCARKDILAVLQHSEFNLKQQQQQQLRWCLISKQQNLIVTDFSWYSGAPAITAVWIIICIDVIKSKWPAKSWFVNPAYDKGGCVLKDRFQKLSRSNEVNWNKTRR